MSILKEIVEKLEKIGLFEQFKLKKKSEATSKQIEESKEPSDEL